VLQAGKSRVRFHQLRHRRCDCARTASGVEIALAGEIVLQVLMKVQVCWNAAPC
jgi:hypothetical protein